MPADFGELASNGILMTGGGGALVALALYLRRLFKSMGLEDAQREHALNGVAAHEQVLAGMRSEIDRQNNRITALESRVEELATKLANVRAAALDCYALATECECHGDVRDRLIEHLKQIIREA